MHCIFEAHQHKIFICVGQGRKKVNGDTLLSHTPHVGSFFTNTLQVSLYELFGKISNGTQ